MKEALSSSETSVITIATWRNIPENTILHVLLRLKNMDLITLHEDYHNGSPVTIRNGLEECRLLGCDAAWLL
jgi:hypothetical protein